MKAALKTPTAHTPAPVVDPESDHAINCIDELNREWFDVDALLRLIQAVGEIYNPDQDHTSEHTDLIDGVRVVAEIAHGKADTMQANANQLFALWQRREVTR